MITCGWKFATFLWSDGLALNTAPMSIFTGRLLIISFCNSAALLKLWYLSKQKSVPASDLVKMNTKAGPENSGLEILV